LFIPFALSILFFTKIYASDVNSNLQEYNQKNDLSQKTVDENKGHLILFTRERLERMHAKTLKDVFKLTPIIYYNENRFSLPDPSTSGSFGSYRSNFIRLYVDGVEVTQGWMGSGVMLYGDMNIDFVDHIEFYYAIPSFDTSVEASYLTVFLYSKDPKRDSGGKLSLIQGSRGYNSQTLGYGKQTDKLSYMVNFSHTNAKRETIDNGTSTPLSRDFERAQLFSYIKTKDQIFHLQVLKKNTDSLAGMSWDATPLESQIDYLNLHMDYGIDLGEYWRAQFAYDWLKTDMRQADEYPLIWSDALMSDTPNIFDGQYKNSTYTGELTYKETIGNNRITAGIKGRYKALDSFENNGQDSLVSPFTAEKIFTVFFQDQYAFSEQQLLTLGTAYNYISRNGGVENDPLLELRLGYIYSSPDWSYKTYLYRTQFSLDALSRYLDPKYYQDVPTQTTLGITQEFNYKTKEHDLSFMLFIFSDEDGLTVNSPSAISENTKYFTTLFRYDYEFDLNNKLYSQLYYAHYNDIFGLDKLEDISGYLSLANSYNNFDFYNEIVWHRNSIDWKNYYDLTSSITWNINEETTVTLKGQNLLNRAKETNLFRVNPASMTPLPPLSITPIDQRVTIELEYLF
jgi:iron complex outermembrane receptor protein